MNILKSEGQQNIPVCSPYSQHKSAGDLFLCDGLPAILGGKPAFAQKLGIVRPDFPPLESLQDDFSMALASGNVTNHSQHVREFENRLGRFLKAHVATCNNGFTALVLMIKAAGINAGEVIIPSYTFSATPHAVHWCGATPVFADINADTLCLDPDSVAAKITPQTKAVLTVDLYGISSDYEKLRAITDDNNLLLLADSAPAFGTMLNGEFLGCVADAHCFSFHATKGFSTMEGGAVSSKSSSLIETVARLRNFAQDETGDCSEPGWNGKMMEICALIGIKKIGQFPADLENRRIVANRYREYFSGHKFIDTVLLSDQQKPAWLYYPIIVSDDSVISRDELIFALHAENIICRTYFDKPCHRMTAYKNTSSAHLPVTDHVAKRVISLPVFNTMTSREISLILSAIDRIFRYAKQIKTEIG